MLGYTPDSLELCLPEATLTEAFIQQVKEIGFQKTSFIAFPTGVGDIPRLGIRLHDSNRRQARTHRIHRCFFTISLYMELEPTLRA